MTKLRRMLAVKSSRIALLRRELYAHSCFSQSICWTCINIPYFSMSNVTQFLVDLIFQPGSSLKLVPVINVVILALLVLMMYLLYTKIAVIHIVVMSTLAVGLLLSVNW